MDGLHETIVKVNERMDVLEMKREASISRSRAIIRKTKNIIHSIHIKEEHSSELDSLKDDVASLLSEIADCPEMLHSGIVQDAMMEFAEAAILSSLSLNEDVPSFSHLGITPQSWTLGLADVIGELRRMVLDSLLNNDVDTAGSLFKKMDSIYSEIIMFDAPDSILPIRRKQDIARSAVEKTRTDLTTAVTMRRL